MQLLRMHALALAICSLLVACSAQQQQQAQQSAQSATLNAAVQVKLATVDADAATAVHVESHNGVVTLNGEARNLQQRSAYGSAAASVPGVKRVVNRLTLNGQLRGPRESAADAFLLAKISANIMAQAGVNMANVKPTVHDGTVTLSGSVPSSSIKETILDTVRKTSGVKAVIDRLAVR